MRVFFAVFLRSPYVHIIYAKREGGNSPSEKDLIRDKSTV